MARSTDIPITIRVEDAQVSIARPGDTLILCYSRRLDDDEIEHIRAIADDRLPTLTVAIFDGTSSIVVHRTGD